MSSENINTPTASKKWRTWLLQWWRDRMWHKDESRSSFFFYWETGNKCQYSI